jgi:hypothetical protein
MAGAMVDAGTALAIARAYGVEDCGAAYLITQAAQGVVAGQAERAEKTDQC